MRFSIDQFNERFPDEDACLAAVLATRGEPACPNCEWTTWNKVKGRPVYACSCGYQISPLAGTIFHKSRTSLRKWFYVMYLMAATRSGISAKQVERELGVTYKTAWRMMKQVRTLMDTEGGDKLSGEVEADETYMKAKPWRDSRVSKGTKAFFASPKVVGIVERGGRAKVRVMPRLNHQVINAFFAEAVEPGSLVTTDGSRIYNKLSPTYYHESRIHYGQKASSGGAGLGFYFKPVAGPSTQNIENLWRQLKAGVYGVYRHVSPQHLQSYANEYAWRYSHRKSDVPMFDLILQQVNQNPRS
jgi:transposase